ncbi:GNAT family N-acetyltransferase [Methylobacillus sp. Pita2]|uniref:GNAT family N-acetyltransferase n=1 Tax=Methylobacillus sp. Pita2 TaxID=3383245 RepID=UPI0038B69543
MNIQLHKVAGENPFIYHPELATIWPEPLNAFAWEATEETLALNGADGSEIFLIAVDGAVAGITGYMPYFEASEPGTPVTRMSVSKVCLRWHGVLPRYRGQGISKLVIRQMTEFGQAAFPNATQFIELVPNNTLGVATAAYFSGLGFVATGHAEFIEEFGMEFLEYAIPIDLLRQARVYVPGKV